MGQVMIGLLIKDNRSGFFCEILRSKCLVEEFPRTGTKDTTGISLAGNQTLSENKLIVVN